MDRNLSKCRISYPVLDSVRREFRLLRLKACEAEIGCELRTFSLDELKTKWVALSYCWGDDEAIHPVQVNDETLLIHANLYGFLQQLARGIPADLDVEWIFIDAICIDQSSSSERAAQVLLMQSIYKNASLVISWLKPEVDDVTRLDHLGLADITTNPYWTCLWIVQEVLLAKQLVFIIGHCSFTRYEIFRFVNVLFRSGWRSKKINPFKIGLVKLSVSSKSITEPSVIANICEYEQTVSRKDDLNLQSMVVAMIITHCLELTLANRISDERLAFCNAIDLFSAQRCQVTHDKIYALLGIATCHFTPDYDLPLIELYIQALANYLLSSGYDKASSTFLPSSVPPAQRQALSSHTLFHTFDVNPYNLAVAVVTRTITTFFLPETAHYLYHILHLGWVITKVGSGTADPTDIRSSDRTWYVPRRQPEESAFRYAWEASYKFTKHMWEEINGLRIEGTVVESPEGYALRTVEEWESVALGHCEEVWEAHLKGEGRVPLLQEREAEYMSTRGMLRRSMRSLKDWFTRGVRSNRTRELQLTDS